MSRKYNRQELINLIKSGKLSKKEISELVEEDKLYAEILQNFLLGDEIQFYDAPEPIIQKAEALGEKRERYSVENLVFSLILDSWKSPMAAGVRGTATSKDRRLRFEFGKSLLDIRAEKQDKKWYFVAEITGVDSAEDIVIFVDKIKVSVNELGYFEWTSVTPPKALKMQIGSNEPIDLPELSWKKRK